MAISDFIRLRKLGILKQERVKKELYPKLWFFQTKPGDRETKSWFRYPQSWERSFPPKTPFHQQATFKPKTVILN